VETAVSARLLPALVLFASLQARAATFVVNDPADFPDPSPGDGLCETAAGNGTCTLRAAVMEANALPGADGVTLPAGTYALTRVLALEAADTEADGDLDVTGSLDLVGAGAATTTIVGGFQLPDSGLQGHRVLDVAAGSIVRVSRVTIQGGMAYGTGGGIANAGDLTLSDCVLTQNMTGFLGSEDGGGIANADTGILSVSRCGIVQNYGRNGGGIANAGTARLEETTIGYNFADTGGGAANWGTLTIANSTISGNQATLFIGQFDSFGGFGAAIADHGGLATLEHVTVANNMVEDADVDGTLGTGAGLGVAAGVATTGYVLRDTIVWGSTGPSGGSTGDCGTPAPASLGHNIDGDGTCLLTGPGDQPSTDPGLGPLGDNGGPTATHAIAPGSPPHDAGDGGACPPSDQRGVPRPQGVGCDIGAYEDNFPCNNGMLDAGEACDDGSPLAGGCCAFDCTPVASGVACEDDNSCAQSRCDGAGACVVATNAPAGTPCDGSGAACTIDLCDGAGACAATSASAGTPCERDGDACTIDRCDGAGACAAAGNVTCSPCRRCESGACVDEALLTGCRRPTVAGAARVTLRADLIKWRWARGEETGNDDFGDPAATDDYQLCIFETTNIGSRRLLQGTAFPAGGSCGDELCWTPLGTPPGERGFRYYDDRQPGIASLLLKPGPEGRALIAARSHGAHVELPTPLDVVTPVTVQLQREDGTCWEADYTTSSVSNETRFKARSDP
jgi:hypothetical protein